METLDQLSTQFNWADLALAVVAVAILLVGFSLGFYRQVALVMGAVVGVVVAAKFTPAVTGMESLSSVSEKLGPDGFRVAAYLTLAAIPVGLSLLSFLAFPKIFGKALRIVDSILGGAAGLSWAAILIWCSLLAASAEPPRWLGKSVQDSYLGSRLAQEDGFMSRVLSEELRTRVTNGLQKQLDPLLHAPKGDEHSRG